MKSVVLITFGLTLAVSAYGQSSTGIDLRATGEHRMIRGDTQESATQLAVLDARTKALRAAVTRLQVLEEVKTLGLSLPQLEAYTAVIVELRPEPPATVRGTLDLHDAARRMTGLRKDVDASRAVVKAWSQVQRLQSEIVDQTRRRIGLRDEEATRIVEAQLRNIAALEATLLAARSAAALARTEPSTVGGNAPTADGKQQARELAQAALARAPDLPEAHYAMGDVLVWAEEPVAAEAEYRKALSADGGAVTGRLKLAEALRLQGNFDEAVSELRDILRIDPGVAQAHSDLGMILRAQRNLPEAIAEYREAIRVDPMSWDAHNGLAITLANNKQLPEAVAEFREVVRLDPDSAIGYYNLAFALADMDLDVESAAALREVIRINPNHYNARFNLGELFRLEGKYDDSATQFREYLRLAPNTPQNQRNIARATRYVKEFGD